MQKIFPTYVQRPTVYRCSPAVLTKALNIKSHSLKARPRVKVLTGFGQLCGDRLNPGRKTRQLTRYRVPVNHAIGDATLHFRLCGFKRCLSDFFISTVNRQLDLLYESTNATDAGVVYNPAPFITANTFLGRLMMCHMHPTPDRFTEMEKRAFRRKSLFTSTALIRLI